MADCVVVGAGLIGMLTAQELAARGIQVTILERGQPARESSWAGGGILSPLYPWRYPDPVRESAGNRDALADLVKPGSRFGRKFRIASFRWLSPAEI